MQATPSSQLRGRRTQRFVGSHIAEVTQNAVTAQSASLVHGLPDLTFEGGREASAEGTPACAGSTRIGVRPPQAAVAATRTTADETRMTWRGCASAALRGTLTVVNWIARLPLAGCLCAIGVAGIDCGGAVADDSAGANSADSGAGSSRAVPDAGGRGPVAQVDGVAPVPCGGGACPSPADVSAFVPTWRPPTGAHQGLCTPALIDEYYQDCLSLGEAQACDAFQPGANPAHLACGNCITSNFTDPTWGPLVRSANVLETNGSGCIALLDPSAIECARAVQANDECDHAACDGVCGAAGAAPFDEWDQCGGAANACGCSSWFAASNCIQAVVGDGGPASQCLVGQTFEDFFSVTAQIFCGN